ncbi:MAG: ECF transporter S component [Candidatus Micrarchaeota archaeon]
MGTHSTNDAYIPLVLAGSLAGACLKFAAPMPNIELLLPFVMAAGMLSGSRRGFIAGFSIRMIYDFYLGMPGPWTIYTTLAYGLVGLIASAIPINESRKRLVFWAAGLTIVYDVLTMAGFGLSFGLPLVLLLGPQVPFTILHLAGNCVFVFAILPGTLAAAKKLASGELLKFHFITGVR